MWRSLCAARCAAQRSTKTFVIEGVGRAPNSKRWTIGFPDDLPLLELIGPRDQFRDDVIHSLHLVEHTWLDGFRVTIASFWDCGLVALIVEVLFEAPQDLRRDLNVSRSGCLHKIQSRGESSGADAAGRFACEGATLVHSMHRQPLSLTRLSWCDRMRARITESEMRCFLFRCELGWSFDYGS